MPVVPTVFGELIEHSESALREAEKQLRTHLDKLEPDARKAQQSLVEVGDIWTGADGTRAQRGPRVLPTPDAIQRVARMVRDKRPEVRTQVLITLAVAMDHHAQFLDAVLVALDDVTASVRLHAARLLVQFPSLPPEVIPQLRSRLTDHDHQVRWLIVTALFGKIATDTLVGVLLETAPYEGNRVLLHDWLRAAHSIEPMPPRLAARARDLETRFAGS